MVYDSRPLRNPFGTMQPAAQAAGCFGCPANGELAPRTTDNENRQEVRRTGGCMIPKGCPDPRGRPRDAASAAPRNLVHPRIVLSPTSRTSAPPMDIQNAPPRAPRALQYRAMAHRNLPHSARKRHPRAAVWRRALSWTSFKVILIGREGTFFALIDVNCLITNYYDETHTSMSFVFYESIRICTAYCSRQS